MVGPTPLSISISRSGEYWLLAVSKEGPVGVDLEGARNLDVAGLAELTMSESERSYLEAQQGQARLATFYRCWTRKEAVVKASGIGLATNLSQIDVRPAEPGEVVVEHAVADGPARWSVRDLAVGSGLFAALACAIPSNAILLEYSTDGQ